MDQNTSDASSKTSGKPESLRVPLEKDVEAGGATQQQSTPHPRADLPEWKWKGMLAAIYLAGMANGYDVSNVANIQARLYETFHNVELLPWIGLSYSMAVFASLSLTRKIMLCFNLRWTLLFVLLVFGAGAAVAGAAQNMATVIVGRVLMGIAASIGQQINVTYIAVYALPAEVTKLFGLVSVFWAIGVVVGGPIGSSFAANYHTTWRWAFYINVPWIGLVWLIALFTVPNRSFALPLPLWKRLTKIDPIGILLHAATTSLFAVAVTFSGPIYAWNSAGAIVLWVLFGLVLLTWIAQQYGSILTTPEQRAFPVHLLSRFDLLPVWIASACAGAIYSVTLYYTPLYFSFTRGYDALPQTVRILPFILPFIVSVMFTGGALPALPKYTVVYIAGGILTLAGGAAMAATLDTNACEAQVLGLEALIGVGLGMIFQHGAGITSALTKDPRQRVDAVIVFQMFQFAGIAVVLSFAGSIYQNVGFTLLKGTLSGSNFTDEEMRQALAGVASTLWESGNADLVKRGVDAVTKVIARIFWIVTSSGAVSLACGLLMRRERLPGKPVVKKEES